MAESTYQKIFNLIEEAVYIRQLPDVDAIVKYIKNNSNLRSIDKKEIDKILWKVCTQYEKIKDKEVSRS